MVQVRVVSQDLRAVPGPTGGRIPPRGLPLRAHQAMTLRAPEPRHGAVARDPLPMRIQIAGLACSGQILRIRYDRSPGARTSCPSAFLMYNEHRKRRPRSLGTPFRCFGRAEMDRDDAERIVTELFTSSYSSTVRYAAHRCGSLDLAEDLVQEAFGALYARLREGARIQNPRAWVMKTVHNKICKTWSKTQRQPERAMSRLELEALPAPADDFGDISDSARPHLEGFLSRLAPREREVILLRAQGLRYREIANQLGISSNSVGTLLLRAMRKMRAARAESILRSVREPAPSS